MLEKNILKLTHKSFHQIVVLGSSSFVPFMQLSGGARREVIEDLLDINIFSKMNSLLKEKMSILKGEMQSNNHQIELVKTKINSQKKYLRDLSAVNATYRKDKETEIEVLQAEVETLQARNTQLSDDITSKEPPLTKQIADLTKKSKDLNDYLSTFKAQAKVVVKEAKFFDENEHCPTCDQDIAEELRKEKKDSATSKAKGLKTTMDEAEIQRKIYEDDIVSLESRMSECLADQNTLHNNNQTIIRLQRSIDKLRTDLNDMADSSGDMGQANSDLSELDSELHQRTDEKYVLNEKASYNRIAGELLRDTGIKTKIIRQYIPVINELTNKYLQILDFFVHFELDDSFSETIRSRYRDTFSYDSFSEGEKQRIDLSLLFTWRQIAKMKNSVSTNLLILDETFDSSLDGEGVDNLMKIIDTLKEDTNVFVISHKTELEDAHFERKLTFVKDKNFSRMKEST